MKYKIGDRIRLKDKYGAYNWGWVFNGTCALILKITGTTYEVKYYDNRIGYINDDFINYKLKIPEYMRNL